MARRPSDAIVVCCPCTDAEAAVLEEMKRASGVTSDANLLRVALWSLADHLGIDMPDGVFDQRTPGNYERQKRNRPNPKIRQEPAATQVTLPAEDHPWRLQERASWEKRCSEPLP